MIERYKSMYGLNYTGASQVWAMSERMGQEGGKTPAEIAEEIKKFQETPGYRSDSGILQDLLNTVKNDGIKIGKIEFDQTELPAIREAAQEIKNYLLRKQEIEPAMAILDTVTEAISNPIPGSDYDSRAETWRIQMQPLIAAMGSDNPYAREASERLVNSILPNIPMNPSQEIINLLDEFEREGRGMGGGRGTHRVANEDTLSRLNAIMDRLETRLNTPLVLEVVTEKD